MVRKRKKRFIRIKRESSRICFQEKNLSFEKCVEENAYLGKEGKKIFQQKVSLAQMSEGVRNQKN